jgi:hypothetical protein
VKTVEEHLSENWMPATYDPYEANHVFSFIDAMWGSRIHGTGNDAGLDMTCGSIHPKTIVDEEGDFEEDRKVSSFIYCNL